MRFSILVMVLFGVIASAAACQSSPPTVVYVVISPTPEMTPSPTPTEPEPSVTASLVAPTATVTLAPTQTNIATQVPAAVSQPTTERPDNLPTPTTLQIQVAEQLFEGGRMFWIQPVSQIWVMVVDEEGTGRWLRYEDTFQEGEIELDPALVAPDGLLQPSRGFGKLWRENPEIRDILGWAVTPEFGYVSRYEYHVTEMWQLNAEGTPIAEGTQVPGFGYHILFSLYGEQFRFDERSSTWHLD